MSVCRRRKLDPLSSLYTKITSKFIKDYNIKPETMKLLEKMWEVPYNNRDRERPFNRIAVLQKIHPITDK